MLITNESQRRVKAKKESTRKTLQRKKRKHAVVLAAIQIKKQEAGGFSMKIAALNMEDTTKAMKEKS
jgi:hypothetical protein